MIILALAAFIALASAQEGAVKAAVSAAGIPNPSVSVSGAEVTIAYNQSVSAFGTFDSELSKVASVLKAVFDNLPSAALVIVEQHFDDGQIMAISGKPSDGKAFLAGQMSKEAFLASLDFNPVTRGPPIMAGICEPSKGENCRTAPECLCYPNEACQPGGQGANSKGCIVSQAPSNAHLAGTEYACDDGYEWSADLTDCVPEKACPENAFNFLGECECLAGYARDSGGADCISTGASGTPTGTGTTTGTGTAAASTAKTSSQKGILDQISDAVGVDKTVLILGGVAFLIMIVLVAVALRLRGHKKPPQQPQQQAYYPPQPPQGSVIVIRQ